MFKRFTERARRVIILAREEAEKRHNEVLGTEFILHAILKDGGGMAISVLQKFGIDLKQLIMEIERTFLRGHTNPPSEIPFSPKAKKVLEYAVEEARFMGHNYIGTEHLILGLLKEKDGTAAKILNGYGVYLVEARDQTLELLQDQGTPSKEKSRTPTLDEFSRDLSDLARQFKLDPVIGRTDEIERVIEILSRRTKNNPVLIGEPGVGKTAIVEGLAQRILQKDVPQILYDKRVMSLDLGSLVAGTKYRGQFEARMKAIIKEIKEAENIVVFIDELHTLVGAGAAEGSVDASNMLKPALSRGEVQCIGATTLDEYRKYIEKNGALERRFQPIMVTPPTVEQTIEIIKGLRDLYELHHHAKISDESIVAAARLSDRYVSGRFLPDKAIDVVDEAGSRVRLRKITLPPDIRELQRDIDAIAIEKKRKIERQEFEAAVELRDKEENLRRQLEQKKKEWEESQENSEPIITSEDVSFIVSRMTGIPLNKIEEQESKRLLLMEEEMHKRIIGQDEAIKVVSRAVRRSRAGLKDPRRPIGTFIFLGPTGVGKTELARALTEFMFGDEAALIRVDMSEYMERFSVSRLTGAPPGYVGYEEGGQLTEQVRRRPYSVILLDEIEKAHPDVFHIMLQIMDDGQLTDNFGRVVNFKNTVLIMTSNLSGRTVSKNTTLGFQKGGEEASLDRMKETVGNELKRIFNPEFLNRIDETVVFHPLKREHMVQIVDLLIHRLNKQLNEKGISLKLDNDARNWLADKGFDPAFGARPLKRTIQKHVEDPLSEEVLKGKFKDTSKIFCKVEGDSLVFLTQEDMAMSPAF